MDKMKNIFILFAVVMLITSSSYGQTSDQTASGGQIHDGSILEEKKIERAYIELTKSIESEEKEVMLSYDTFAEEYRNSNQELSEFTEKTKQNELLKSDEIAMLPEEKDFANQFELNGNYESYIDKETIEQLEMYYDKIKSENDEWDVSLDTFVSDYISTESTNPKQYSNNITETLKNDDIKSQSSSFLSKWYYNTGSNLPQVADYSKNGLLKTVKKGDIIYEANGGMGITGHAAIVEGVFYNTTYDQFYVRIIEAMKSITFSCVGRSVLDDTRVEDKDVTILRLNSANFDEKLINNAVIFCQSQTGKLYQLDVPAHDTSSSELGWYCSELVWAGYKNQGLDLEIVDDTWDDEPGITPRDLLHSIYLDEIAYDKKAMSFDDISSHWAQEYIKFNVDNGLMNGISSTYFCPDENISRAMFVTMLYRLAGTPTDIGNNNYLFFDVPKNAYYYQAVSWASSKGIVNGTASGAFYPEDSLSREDLVVMMYRFCREYLKKVHYKDMEGKTISDEVKYGWKSYLGKYSDYDDISSYARQAVSWAVWNQILTGTSDTQLSPGKNCTRAQAATFMYRFVSNYLFLYD